MIRGKQGQLFAPPTERHDDEEILRTLDRRQESLARGLGSGYRLIRGVAGSGKTLVLTHRAQYVAGHFPHWRILLVCFNKALSLALEQQMQEREILDLGRQLLAGIGQGGVVDRSPDDLDVLVQPEQAERIGRTPACLTCADLRREAEVIAERVVELGRSGAAADEIVVLLGTEDLRHDVMRMVPDAFDTRAGRNRHRIFDVQGKVRVATLGLLKGLEFRHVIIGGANHILIRPGGEGSEAEDQRRLLYVAVTTATETLTITYSGEDIMSDLTNVPLRGPPASPPEG